MDNFDNIPYRIKFIKNLLDNKNFIPLINFNNNDTEYFENSSNNIDTRTVLNKKCFDFNTVINKIGGKLLYIKSGSTGHTFKGIFPTNNGEINYAVKIVAYPKRQGYGNLYDIRRPENAEILALKTLSYFVVNNQSPHIVLPILTFNTPLKPFTTLSQNNIVNNKKYDEFIKKYLKGDFYEEASILISEWANKGDLLDYVRNNYKKMQTRDWRVIFFQIISVLAVILKKYPTFRHNDLKANNILLQKINIDKKYTKFKYEINGKEYVVPNIGYQIKIWDFDFACIPGIVDNSKVSAEWTNKINIKCKKNQYYDIHFFFNTLTKKGFFPQFWESEEIDIKVKQFVSRIVPKQYREGENVADRGRLLLDVEYTTPEQILLEDVFFDKMRPNNDKVIKLNK